MYRVRDRHQGIYLKYAQQLVEQGDAYYCFCKKEELENMKRIVAGKEISIYDKRCLQLSQRRGRAPSGSRRASCDPLQYAYRRHHHVSTMLFMEILQ